MCVRPQSHVPCSARNFLKGGVTWGGSEWWGLVKLLRAGTARGRGEPSERERKVAARPLALSTAAATPASIGLGMDTNRDTSSIGAIGKAALGFFKGKKTSSESTNDVPNRPAARVAPPYAGAYDDSFGDSLPATALPPRNNHFARIQPKTATTGSPSRKGPLASHVHARRQDREEAAQPPASFPSHHGARTSSNQVPCA